MAGRLSEKLRYYCCRLIFKKCGTNVNIGRNARFGNGKKIEIGNNSGIGMNAVVPGNIIIGSNVMMGVNVTIFGSNHAFDRTDIPMIEQGYKSYPPVIIEDDVWIGNNVIVSRLAKKKSHFWLLNNYLVDSTIIKNLFRTIQ